MRRSRACLRGSLQPAGIQQEETISQYARRPAAGRSGADHRARRRRRTPSRVWRWIDGATRSLARAIGLDVHREFCVIASCEPGWSAARIASMPSRKSHPSAGARSSRIHSAVIRCCDASRDRPTPSATNCSPRQGRRRTARADAHPHVLVVPTQLPTAPALGEVVTPPRPRPGRRSGATGPPTI